MKLKKEKFPKRMSKCVKQPKSPSSPPQAEELSKKEIKDVAK